MRTITCVGLALTAALVPFSLAAPTPQSPVQLELLLPLGRHAYQTNERIDLAVVRTSAKPLPAASLKLTLAGADGSSLAFTFPLAEVTGGTPGARQTEHLYLNGWLLRPGKYTVTASADGALAKTNIDLHSHVRRSSFKLIDWASHAKPEEQEALGEDSLGFNLLYASYGGLGPDATVRGGLDYMWCCTMSGAHQMDMRMECDWSDPYVLGGGTARVVRRAFQDRTNPNAIGVHFYDEPGLTWHKHPVTGEFTPHNIPWQDRAYKSAFGKDAPAYYKVKPDNPNDVARWMTWGRWKESFMEAAWKHAAFGVNYVRRDYLPVTQSVYGWSAFTDGYYFNVVRTLPAISGHGGYDDYGGAYFNPSYTFEFGRMRDLHKPNWYLPMWYQGMPANRFRLEQYLSFMNNLQGMAKPPDQRVHRPSQARPTVDGVVESNKLLARLGTIFTTMPVDRPPVAVLYSLSQSLAAQVKDMKDNYEGGNHGRRKTFLVYLAGKLIHNPLFPVVEEDILDGTLAAHHKAVVLPGTNYLDPKVITALEEFTTSGGAVLVSDDSQVKIKGAVKLGCPIDVSLYDQMAKAWDTKNTAEYYRLNNAGRYMKTAEPVAHALEAQLRRLGIKPVLECDNPAVIVSRQGSGDVEYLFAVNASYDAGVGGMNDIKPAMATFRLPADGRPVYDAIHGGPADAFKVADKHLAGSFRFGPGQMRVFARTARPIGGVQALTPVLFKDFTVAKAPLRVDVGATVADARGKPLTGSIPLRVRLIDPLGVTRYDLYRATKRGTIQMGLPLAVNDPKGEWLVVVQELLTNTEDTARFTYAPLTQCGAVAGAARRAVSFVGDRENVFRFFSVHKAVTIATGTSEFNTVAANRLADILKPWGVHSKIVKAADLNRPREISEDEARTWCGLEPGKVKPGRSNNPAQVGFDVKGPVILLGTPADNPLIDFLHKAHFLPFPPEAATFPGPGRGYLAWQRDGVGYGQESITLIAYDGAGMAEAVGTLYEAATGLRSLTPWKLPSASSVTPASMAPPTEPSFSVAWQRQFPDRAAALQTLPGDRLVVLTQDGSLTVLDAQGKAAWQKTLTGGDAWALDSSADDDLLVVGASQHLVGLDGKGKQLFDVPVTADQPASNVTFVAVSPDGKHVAAGAANGKLTLLAHDGKRLWSIGGVNPADKNAQPNPYRAGIFTADSKILVALTQNEAHVVNLKDGQVMARVGGVSSAVAPQRLDAHLLLSDGNSVTVYAPEQNKVVGRGALPGGGVACLASVGIDVLIGTEVDGLVARLKTAASRPSEQMVWQKKTPGRLVKQLTTHGGLAAVAYWGGLVRVFDAGGAVKAARAFPQDVVGLAWNGKQLVVALSDGGITSLRVP
jgi:hypothetical protein